MKLIGLLLTAFFALAPSAYAQASATDFNMTINRTGASMGDGYVYFVQTLSEPCLNGIVYFDTTTEDGRVMYSILISRYLSGKTVYRVVYTRVTPPNICTASLVEI